MFTRRLKLWKTKNTFFLFILLYILIPSSLIAQEYPTKPIKVSVGYAPGGGGDISTRALVNKAEKFLNRPFIVSNIGGGGGSVALGVFIKEKPDGYSLVSAATTAFALVPQFRPVSYRLEEFVPISAFAEMQNGTVVRADSPWRTLKEFVEYAKQNPGKVTYGTPGIGTLAHLGMEYITKQEGIQWTHVPYPGTGPILTALLGGHITAGIADPTFIPHVKGGALRLLATYGKKRMKIFSDVPTLNELGYDFRGGTVFLVAAPRGIPTSIVQKLDEAFCKSIEDAEFIRTVAKIGYEATYLNHEDIKKHLKEDYILFGELLKELKIKGEPEKK